MAPEQQEGRRSDARADIYAFGCVLYEMLTGKRVAMARAPVEPPALERVITRCLAPDPDDRFQSAHDVKIAIEWAAESQVGVPSAQRRHTPWVAAAVAVLLAAILGGWAVSRARRVETAGSMLRLQINPPQGGQFGGLEQITELALSPDGRTAVFGAAVGGTYALWLRSLDDINARLLPGTEDASSPFWSPDGNAIAFISHGKLRRMDIAGGTPFVICDVPRAYGGSWAPDGRILVGVFVGTIASVPASGGTLSPLTAFDKSRGDIAHVWPQVLPGGHFLYWAASSKPEHDGVIYAASFEKPNERIRLVTTETRAIYASSPDGHGYLLWQRAGTLVAQQFDGATLKLSGEARPLAESVGVVGAMSFIPVAVSTNGTLVYAPAHLRQLTWFDRAGKQLGTVGDRGLYAAVSTRVSPDGKQIATTRMDTGRELWVIDAERGTSRRMTHDSWGGFNPQWSLDGRTLLFVGEAVTALYRKEAAGTAPDERLANWPGSRLTDWSREGRFLLHTRNTVETQNDVWVVSMTSDGHLAGNGQPKPYLRTPVNESEARFSPEPNPHWVAYQSDESGRYEIYIQSFPAPHGPHRISVQGGTRPQWGPGSRELFYQSLDNKVMVVNLTLGSDTVEASEPRTLFTIPPESFFEVAPDGRHFLVPMPDPAPHPLNVIVNWPALMKPTAKP
jgi:Tol biopolymer transport system component